MLILVFGVLCWDIGGPIKSKNQRFGTVFYKDAQLWFWTPAWIGIVPPCQLLWLSASLDLVQIVLADDGLKKNKEKQFIDDDDIYQMNI